MIQMYSFPYGSVCSVVALLKLLRPSMFPVSKYSVGLPSQYFAVPSKAEMINSAVAALWTVTCD